MFCSKIKPIMNKKLTDSTATAKAPKKKNKVAAELPEHLIYEVRRASPLTSECHKYILNGTKSIKKC